MLRAARTLRLDALFFSVPYTFVWARALGGASDGLAASGPLILGAHASLLLLALILSDRREVERGREARLSLRRDRFTIDPEVQSGAIPVLALIAGVLTLVLLVADPLAGLVTLIGAAALLWHAVRPLARKYTAIEAIAPVVLLGVPGLLVWCRLTTRAASARNGAEGAESIASPGIDAYAVQASAQPTLGATLLGAACLGLYLLLCLLRDAPIDRAEGVRTIATGLTDSGVRAVVWAWSLAVVLLAAMGAGWQWWGWGVSAAFGVEAMCVVALAASRSHDRAVTWWAFLHALGAIALMFSVAN